MVVTLEPPEGGGGGGDPLVVVGACAAVERPRATPELSVAGLGSPDWESSVSRVLQHYPAGTRAGGVWVRVEEEGEQEQSRINLIVRHTKLKVSLTIVMWCKISRNHAYVQVLCFCFSFSK